MIGGSSDQVLLFFSPETPSGNHSLDVLIISLTDSLAEITFVAESTGTTDSITSVGVGLMTLNSAVSLVDAAIT